MASAASLAIGGRPPRRLDPSVVLFGLAGLASAGLLLWAVGDPVFAAAFLAGLIGAGGALLLVRRRPAAMALASAETGQDLALLRDALDSAGPALALAVSDEGGRMISANRAWTGWFGADALPLALARAAPTARRDKAVQISPINVAGRTYEGEVRLAGAGEGRLLWRISRADNEDLAREARRLITGEAGRRMGEAGLMVAVVDAAGTILAANGAFAVRAAGPEGEGAAIAGSPFVDHLAASAGGQFHFAAEGKAAPPLRIVQVPAGDDAGALSLFLLLDDIPGPRGEDDNAHVHTLLDSLPLGLALADTDGRFIFLNKVFRKAVALGAADRPAWPGDLVVDEDKAAVSDAVRRFGRGRPMSGDLAVRLKSNPEEPVAMTVAGARGLGNAAVLLSLKDNSEEARLKREIAQATKMQAVGQLAGGVAHDFNNILTAILGTCDLMMMRHAPGDSDYDDIQQIRSNSNRAANLTRQLLAFSRQQTLRPQVLQLPDVVAEVSHLLDRLLGERIKLEVKHGRGLGAVRADPGQLEQVIVNLAVNARDAMIAKDSTGGTLILQTFGVSADDVRRMGSDVLPIGDYTGLKVVDTGIGIPQHLLSKIFEPFFTTKEVGKGTGLGLSTVYGIVKQSGGFIFAESQVRKGTSFTIYLPVHRTQPGEAPAKAKAKEKAGELWGTGTVLIVEDEVMVRAVAERALTRHGYTVLVAENGEAALEILGREDKVDLMISDVVMPTMDGPTTVRAARKMHPDLPILFISGYAEEQLRKSIDIPNVAFLAKPFSVQQLAETVRDVLAAK
ncbi:MAG: two-component system, cell cycle sensor histidine kinase and response regulator CckA [Sphingomonadales bacterium]|jgi:two-component system cell cycle sensor histidine kinase/response regulator CckA|nr:two-component system, cell cycle sensor histidine kinase and response regulator CckA [Sphingomonadales bacterium]